MASRFASELAKRSGDVASPDGNIVVSVVGGSIESIAFRPGMYDQYSEPRLASQLEQLAKLVLVARTRARREALQAAIGYSELKPAGLSRKTESNARREFNARRDEASIVVDNTYITLAVIGGREWKMEIEENTIDSIDELQFVGELASLVREAISYWVSEVDRLRNEVFGPNQLVRRLQ